MKKAIIILIIAFLAAFFLYLGIRQRLYNAISQENLVGIVRCVKSPDKNYDFYLFYFPIINGKPSNFRFIKLKGSDWVFEGEIIKWKKPLNIIGCKTIQRPIRISDLNGTFFYLETQPRKIIFKAGKLLPCVDTSFISAVRQPFIPKTRFGIYITNSGYLIRKIR